MLEELTSEFLAILEKCPSRLKKKIMSSTGSSSVIPDPTLPTGPTTSFKPLIKVRTISSDQLNLFLNMQDDKDMKRASVDRATGDKTKSMIASSTGTPTGQPKSSSGHSSVPMSSVRDSQSSRRSTSPSYLPASKKARLPSPTLGKTQLATGTPLSGIINSNEQKKETSGMSYSAYKEKKEKERISQPPQASSNPAIQKELPSQNSYTNRFSHSSANVTRDVKSYVSDKLNTHSVPSNSQPVVGKTGPPLDKQRQVDERNKPFSKSQDNLSVVETNSSKSLGTQAIKQQQIKSEKQRQMDERNKFVPKPQENLFDKNLSFSNTVSQHSVKTDFHNMFENFSSKPASSIYSHGSDSQGSKIWDNPFSNGDDSQEARKGIVDNIKMEFSDNDSNPCEGPQLSLSSLPPLIVPENKTEANDKANSLKNSSFMSIFATESSLINTDNSKAAPEALMTPNTVSAAPSVHEELSGDMSSSKSHKRKKKHKEHKEHKSKKHKKDKDREKDRDKKRHRDDSASDSGKVKIEQHGEGGALKLKFKLS